MLAQRIAEIKDALVEAGLDGWFFACFQHNDPVGFDLLGLGAAGRLVTRRCYYLLTRDGRPRKLVHALEPAQLEFAYRLGASRLYLVFYSAVL